MQSLFKVASGASDAISKSAHDACGSTCGNDQLSVIFASVTNALIFLIGALSVIMIIVGALRYVISNGDSKQTEAARNTILYAVIGLILAIASYGIVNFVVTHFAK